MVYYYTRTVERRETVVEVVSSSNRVAYIDRTPVPEMLSSVRLGNVETKVINDYRELSTVELSLLKNVHPQIDPLANEYGKPTVAPKPTQPNDF